VLVPNNATIQMLARDLSPLPIKRIAVAVARGIPKRADLAIFLEPAHVHVVWNIAPD
jgi:hypothetical protein